MKEAWKRLFWNDDEGTILAEALIVIPLVTIFAVGILEFGNVFWQRHLLEVGVRDAARYWARCRPDFMSCSVATARNIAFYGIPNPSGPTALRVPNWSGDDALTFSDETPPTNPTSTDTVIVTGTMSYSPSPLFGLLGFDGVEISYSHEQRYYGW
jgi:hypothetical protein